MKVEKMWIGEDNTDPCGERTLILENSAGKDAVAVIPWDEWEAQIKAAREEVLKMAKTSVFILEAPSPEYELAIIDAVKNIDKAYQERFNE